MHGHMNVKKYLSDVPFKHFWSAKFHGVYWMIAE